MMRSSEKVINAAVEWWLLKRPIKYNLQDHLVMPKINCFTDVEKDLAMAVAEYIGPEERCQVCGAKEATHDKDHLCRMHRTSDEHGQTWCEVCGKWKLERPTCEGSNDND
jgi:hypothetical protein